MIQLPRREKLSSFPDMSCTAGEVSNEQTRSIVYVPNKAKLTKARASSGRVRMNGLSVCFWMIVAKSAMLIQNDNSESRNMSRE